MNLFKSKAVPVTIGDRIVNFYSLSIPVLYALKSAIGPAAKLLTNFFRGSRNDVARLQEKSVDKDGRPVEIVSASPMSLDMVKFRSEQSEAAHREILAAFFGDENRLLLGRVLMDSMRDEFPRKPSPQQIEEFMEGLDLDILAELIKGVAQANTKVFGPLARQWAEKAQSQLLGRGSSESPISDELPEKPQGSEPKTPPAPQLLPKD